MTHTELLTLISQAKTYEEVSDDSLERYMEYLDSLFELHRGYRPISLEEVLNPSVSARFPELEAALDEFEVADPQLVHWFAWMPFRFYMQERWPLHVEIHNAKVRREFPDDEWAGLYI